MELRLATERDVAERLAPVILGADILGYTLCRTFWEEYGLTSIVLGTADVKATSSSKFCEYRVVPEIEDAAYLVTYLSELGEQLASAGKVGLLLGCGDWYARTLSKNKGALGQWYVVPYIDFDLLDRLTQKEVFYGLCEELGIAYPKTWTFDCSDADATIDVHAFTYPLIAKPSNSAAYHYAEFPGKKKIFEIERPEELARVFDELKRSSYDRELIVQEFIPGPDDGLRSITIFVDEHGEPVMKCMGRVVLQDHAPSAIGNPVCILSEWAEQPMEDACRLLKHVGYRGFANFDVKVDPRDGSYRFFEVNTRMGRNSYYVNLAGGNIARMIVDEYVLGCGHAPVDASRRFLYACVPAYVVKRSVEDEALRREVLALYRDKTAAFPLFCSKDTWRQRFWALVTYYNQIRKFKRFFWDTDGKQVDVA